MSTKSVESHSSSSQDFLERLQHHPLLKARFESLLDIVENSSGDVLKADQAEERVFEEIRQMGQQAIESWAQRKHQKIESECDARRDLSRKEKKDSTGTLASGQ